MSLGAEIARSIRGAFRIAMLDADAPRWFNLSVEGFWRSFLAPVMLAPFYFGLILYDAGAGAGAGAGAAAEGVDAADPDGLILLRVLSFTLGWVVYPLAMIPIARMLQLGGAYVPYIIMWNWSAVPQAALMVPALLAVEIMQPRAAGLLFMSAMLTVLFYGYLVARAGLRCAPATAAGVVVLDLVLSLLINAGVRVLFAPA